MIKKMATCNECKFYIKIDETKGDCFGYEVPADRDVTNCLTKAFQPKIGKKIVKKKS